MLIKALGVIDFIAGLILIFGTNFKIPFPILIIFGIFLIVKAAIGLLKDFASWIDLAGGMVFIILIFLPLSWIIGLIAGILLIQKGIVSFL